MKKIALLPTRAHRVSVIGSLEPTASVQNEALLKAAQLAGIQAPQAQQYYRTLLTPVLDLTPNADGIIRAGNLGDGQVRARVSFLGRNHLQFNLVAKAIELLKSKDPNPKPTGEWLNSVTGEKLPVWELPLEVMGNWYTVGVNDPDITDREVPVNYHLLDFKTGMPRKVPRRVGSTYVADTAKASVVVFFAYEGEDPQTLYDAAVNRLRPAIHSWKNEVAMLSGSTVDSTEVGSAHDVPANGAV